MAVELHFHDPRWEAAFAAEGNLIAAALEDTLLAIHHIGSTAIPGILAKPVIDILCVVSARSLVDAANPNMVALGYRPKGENGIEARRYFQKRDAADAHTHHVHAFEAGAPDIERHLAFRDFLRAHPDKAADYSRIKAMILSEGVPSRQAYQDAKSGWIAATLADALRWYRADQSRCGSPSAIS